LSLPFDNSRIEMNVTIWKTWTIKRSWVLPQSNFRFKVDGGLVEYRSDWISASSTFVAMDAKRPCQDRAV